MLLFYRMLRVVTLKCLTKEHVVHGVIRMVTNHELAYCVYPLNPPYAHLAKQHMESGWWDRH